MTPFAAFFLVCIVGLTVIVICTAIEYSNAAHYWRRFERTCGGKDSALRVLKAAEACEQHGFEVVEYK